MHPHEIAVNVRLCAPPLPESSGMSRALRNPVMKFADRVRPCTPLPLHESSGFEQQKHVYIFTLFLAFLGETILLGIFQIPKSA